jgi:hypothetical protein
LLQWTVAAALHWPLRMQARVDARCIWLSLLLGLGALVAEPRISEACGCLSPPAVSSGDYAVNQQSEQIIFEVEPGWVTAHVLIKYAGKPESFAWIIPVPEVPELGISPVSAFGLLDQMTAPDVGVTVENICPVSEWACRYHHQPSCGDDSPWGADNGAGGSFADAGALDGAGAIPPVTVISEQVVGDYQTVTFRANEAQAATQWLRDNGFIVNQTTSIYMEPYVQANMVFIAAKLVPGAGISSIKPLKLRYRAAFPMVPLLLTAVAAEPHLTVTTFLYGNDTFRPMGHPVVEIDPQRLARDGGGRLNYPMVLSRVVDDAGGDGFVMEYRGNSPVSDVGQTGNCCGNGQYDFCGIGGNSQCECPRDEFDREDCEAEGDVIEGVALLDDLAARYTTLTRITTRISPEEMTFDPTFEREFGAPRTGRLSVRGSSPSLATCEPSVIDQERYQELEALQGCASLYCGVAGHCVTTVGGAACECMPGAVAQRFTDLDGAPSVTCVPRVPTVDLRANGEQLPDACAGISCGTGSCIDRNGVAVCACDPGTAARAGGLTAPRCEPIEIASQTRGAADYSEPMRGLSVCAAKPPTCGSDGWLEKVGTTRPGAACGNVDPPAELTRPGPKPTCSDGLLGIGCGGCQQGEAPVPTLAGVWIIAALFARRRRRARAK